jgi:hypothetical protein
MMPGRFFVNIQDLRGQHSNRVFDPMKTRPAGGDMSFRVRDRITPVNIGMTFSTLIRRHNNRQWFAT